MANISTLTVSLTAETAKFENGLKKSKKSADKFGKAIGAAFKVAGAATIGLVGSLSALTRQSLITIDQQQKMADRLGLTQKALVGLALAGEQTGTTQRNLQLALQRSTRRIAEAAQGTGTAVSALKDLNLEASSLSTLSPDEAFIKIAKAFESIEGQSERVRLAFKLFDSEGVGLVNTLKLGEAGIRGFIEEADRLGIALGRNQTKAIEDANDASNIFRKSLAGLGNQLAVQFAPSIARAAKALSEFVISISTNVERLAIALKDLLGIQTELDNLTLDGLRQEYALTQNRITELNAAIAGQQKRLEENAKFRGRSNLAIQLAENRAELEDLTAQLDKIIAQQKELGSATPLATNVKPPESGAAAAKFKADFDAASASVATASEKLQAALSQIRIDLATNPLWTEELAGRQAQAAVAAYVAELKAISDAQQAIIDAQKNAAEAATRSVATPAEELRYKLDEIRTNLEENPFWSPETAQRQAQEAVDAYLEETKRIAEGAEDVFAELNEYQEQAARNAQDIFAEFLFDPFGEGLDGMLKSFVDMLRKMVAQLIASKLLTSFLSLFPGTSAAGGVVGASTPGPAAAIGGLREAGRPVLVGERGPEMFTPGASGAIRPLGAVTVEQTNNFGGSGDLNAATLIPILEENNRRVKAEILDAFDRGAFA